MHSKRGVFCPYEMEITDGPAGSRAAKSVTEGSTACRTGKEAAA